MALDIPEASMLIEGVRLAAGANLIVGAAKSGKTLEAVQEGIAIASGSPLYGFYKILNPGPVLFIEQDDPAGAGSIKTILERSTVPVAGIPFHLVALCPTSSGRVPGMAGKPNRPSKGSGWIHRLLHSNARI